MAVIHAPPHGPDTGCDWTDPLHPECDWGENYLEAAATFGRDVGQGEGSATGSTTTIGGEVSLDMKIHEIGPSFTYGWEKSYSVERSLTTTTVEGSKFSTRPAYLYYDEASDSGLDIVKTDYDCYVYHEATYGDMDVCVPLVSGEAPFSLDWWYTHAITMYPDSWVPVGINLAQRSPSLTASQASEYTTSSPAGRAVDGNVDGNWGAGSVSHTGNSQNAWWQVDLGAVQEINAVQIWNRTDCCTTRLSNFYLFISKEPFTSNDPAVLAANSEIWHHYVSGAAGRTTTIPTESEYGRYVRVQLDHQDYLNLAEVQVWGLPGEPKFWPRARPTSTNNNQSFVLTWPGGATQTVPGQLLHTWQSPTYKWVAKGASGSEFSIGIIQDGETITSGSTASTTSAGMEIKYLSGEVSYGTEQQSSYILSWSDEINFSGEVGGSAQYGALRILLCTVCLAATELQSAGGVDQAFFVLDYWLDHTDPPTSIEAETAIEGPRNSPLITPTIPLLDSPTHPDPATWVLTDTATFTWRQPPGDPAAVAGYTWKLDRTTGHGPARPQPGAGHDRNLPWAGGRRVDHARAGRERWRRVLRDGSQWSGAAHRTIRVDANPPEVQVALQPAGRTATTAGTSRLSRSSCRPPRHSGSGVASVEFSTDGATWQPYTAPLVFSADTPGTTVYARATDAVGHVSEPISTTFKIDQTPPDSHVAGGQGPGAWVAQVITNTLGNQVLVLVGAIADDGSGQAGMSLEYDGLDWTGATRSAPGIPSPASRRSRLTGTSPPRTRSARATTSSWARRRTRPATWRSLTRSPGAVAAAGLARHRQQQPDRVADGHPPGEMVTFTVVARNAGWQEAHVSVVDTLPAGLTPVIPTLATDVTYDPVARTLTWPARLLWPGQWVRHTFQAQAAAGLPATMLENLATFHASWPNTDLLPPAQQQPFLDHEQTVTVAASVAVKPNLPAGADSDAAMDCADAPVRARLCQWVASRAGISCPHRMSAGCICGSGRRTRPPATGSWPTAVVGSTIRRRSPGRCRRARGSDTSERWVADAAGNVSVLDEHGLVFVNRLDGSQTLADGQRVQYRGDLNKGTWIAAVLTTLSGDPDMYVWRPRNGFRPDGYRNDTVLPGQTEDLGHRFAQESGRYLLEVQAVGASEYQLILNGAEPGNGRDIARRQSSCGRSIRWSSPIR